jgi:hypothetical protein
MHHHVFRPLVITLALLLGAVGASAQAQAGQRCFSETGFCIDGRIREFWEQNGGLPVFGFPTGPQQTIQIEGVTVEAQPFERNRLELHPENTRPYDVLLGRLGVDRLQQQGRDWFTFPKADPTAPHYFSETGHAIAPQFWPLWSSHGLELDGRRGTSREESLALFGMPLSEAAMETNASGATVLTQWFERARFEYHPTNLSPGDVLLGLLGNELRDGAPHQIVPPALPAPTATPAPPPPATSQPTGACDPAYPTVCIPPPPPDLDCSEIPYRNFRVLPPDPHRFDRDKDGIGCES